MSELTADDVLKFAFADHVGRVERTLEIETKLNALLPSGSDVNELLQQICEDAKKRNIAKQESNSDRDVHFSEDLCSVRENESEIAGTMATFDKADRNLIREAAIQVKNLVEVTSNAQHQSLASDSDTKAEN